MEQERFIADDRGVLEHIQKIRAMTDEEFEEYIKKFDEEETEKKADGNA